MLKMLFDFIHRLETDVKKLKADLQASRNCEQELKSQVSSSSSEEKALRSELYQLQQDNENLQNKYVHFYIERTIMERFMWILTTIILFYITT